MQDLHKPACCIKILMTCLANVQGNHAGIIDHKRLSKLVTHDCCMIPLDVVTGCHEDLCATKINKGLHMLVETEARQMPRVLLTVWRPPLFLWQAKPHKATFARTPCKGPHLALPQLTSSRQRALGYALSLAAYLCWIHQFAGFKRSGGQDCLSHAVHHPIHVKAAQKDVKGSLLRACSLKLSSNTRRSVWLTGAGEAGHARAREFFRPSTDDKMMRSSHDLQAYYHLQCWHAADLSANLRQHGRPETTSTDLPDEALVQALAPHMKLD